MSAQVYSLGGAQFDDTGAPPGIDDPEMVKSLEDLLGRLRDGQLLGLAFTAVDRAGAFRMEVNWVDFGSGFKLGGQLQFIQQGLTRQLDQHLMRDTYE